MSIGSTGGAQYQLPDATDGQFAFDIGVAPIPQLYSTDSTHPEYKADYKPSTILQGPNVCIFKKANPQEVVASWLLVKFLTTDIEFQGLYSISSGYTPVIKDVFETTAYKTFLNSGTLIARTATTCKSLVDSGAFYTSPAFVGSSKAREQVELLMKEALTGTKIEDAFQKALSECKYFAKSD